MKRIKIITTIALAIVFISSIYGIAYSLNFNDTWHKFADYSILWMLLMASVWGIVATWIKRD